MMIIRRLAKFKTFRGQGELIWVFPVAQADHQQ